jgi:hypothetical protein
MFMTVCSIVMVPILAVITAPTAMGFVILVVVLGGWFLGLRRLVHWLGEGDDR